MSPLPIIEGNLSQERKILPAGGALPYSDSRRLDVLVEMASDPNAEVSRLAQDILAKLSDEECIPQLAESALPEFVARYFLKPEHVRPQLLPLLLAHSVTPQDAITTLAVSAGPEVLQVLLEYLDLLKTPALVALKENPAYLDWQAAPSRDGFVLEVDLLQMLIEENESETALPSPIQREQAGEQLSVKGKDTILRKIARMTVAKKVLLALRGDKEVRAILIHDGSKTVARAVLKSPKLTATEVQSFAASKNIGQDSLRYISMTRKFRKDYVVLKNLVNNPRLPIDVGLSLVKLLMPNDVRALAHNREVSETIRNVALRSVSTRG